MKFDLRSVGWSPEFAKGIQSAAYPMRIVREEKTRYLVLGEHGELWSALAGKLRFELESKSALPAVGDWVLVQTGLGGTGNIIKAVVPRRSVISRKIAGEAVVEQVLAANIDILFIVAGADGEYNPRRVERYIVLANEGGALPVLVLNKMDCCSDRDAIASDAMRHFDELEIVTSSVVTGEGAEKIRSILKPHKTGALLGSSGVGKSSLVNMIVGEHRQKISELSDATGKGRHTTSRRELIFVPGGGMLIDTPGLREIQLWTGESALGDSFEEIERLGAECRFRDCRHESEPGCAVRAAVDRGEISPERYESFKKLEREISHLSRKKETRHVLEVKRRAKQLSKRIKEFSKHDKRR